MKKIFQWLTGGVIKNIGDVVDKLTTTEEEKLLIKKQIQEILEKADSDAQTQVTERWKVDMQSDSWLSKNIRPAVLIFLTSVFTILSFFDGNFYGFQSTRTIHTNIPITTDHSVWSLLRREDLGKK